MMVIGDPYSGKSNLLLRYIKNEFKLKSKVAIGIEFELKEFYVGSHLIRVKIWDSAQSQTYKSVPK